MNYPKELESLVQEYLTDGVLTAKERQVLLNKAQKLGVDTEEFDLYIDAQVQKSDNKYREVVTKSHGKVCPYCNSPIPPLAETCPECGKLILTAAVNEKIDQQIEKIKAAYSTASSIEVYNGSTKQEALGQIAAAKAELLDLKMKYSSVDKVSIFYNTMADELETLEKNVQKNYHKSSITVVIALLILFLIAGGGFFLVSKYA